MSVVSRWIGFGAGMAVAVGAAAVLPVLAVRAPSSTLPAQEGERWSLAVPLDGDVGGDLHAVALAVDLAGDAGVLWSESKGDAHIGALIYALRAPFDSTWSLARTVAPMPGDPARSEPSIALDSDGALHAVWLEAETHDPRVMHSRLAAGGRAWSTPVRVSDFRSRVVQWSPVVAPDRAGYVHVLWVDFRDGTADVRHRRRAPDGTWTASLRVNGDPAGDQTEVAAMSTPAGDVFAVWVDARKGTRDIYASRLPQYGDAWWPDAELTTVPGPAAGRQPVLAAEGRQAVHALWLDESTRPVSIRGATLRLDDPAQPFWLPDHPVYVPDAGDVGAIDAAGGPGGQVAVVWSEARSAGARVLGGMLRDGAVLRPSRIDGGPARDGRAPRVAVDGRPIAHVAWRGTDRDGRPRVFYSAAALPRPAYPHAEERGWLQYRARLANCGGDAYVLVACDGTPGSVVLPQGADLESAVGRYVVMEGEMVEDVGCPHLAAAEARREAAPCPRDTGAVTGVLRLDGRPVEGARVEVDGMSVTTGRSGRFFVDRVPAGRHAVTATVACALAAALPNVLIEPDLVRRLPDGALVAVDAVPDCAVDGRDLVRVGAAVGTRTEAGDSSCVDLDADGTVGVGDLAAVAGSFGLRCPVGWPAPSADYPGP